MSSLPPMLRFLSGTEHTQKPTARDFYSLSTGPTVRPGDISVALNLSVERTAQGEILGRIHATMARRCIPLLPPYKRATFQYVASVTQRSSDATFWLVIPGEICILRSTVAPFLAEIAVTLGLRPKMLKALDFELFGSRGGGESLLEIGQGRAIAQVAALQERWRARLKHYLMMDVTNGSQRNPGLVEELHVGWPPLETAILHRLVRDGCGNRRRGEGGWLHSIEFPFDKTLKHEIGKAGERLLNADWLDGIEETPDQSGETRFQLFPGPKMRKLSNSDLLALTAP